MIRATILECDAASWSAVPGLAWEHGQPLRVANCSEIAGRAAHRFLDIPVETSDGSALVRRELDDLALVTLSTMLNEELARRRL